MPLQLFRAQVERIRDLTHDVREIELRLKDPPARAHPNFSFITTLSRPEDGWTGERGRVTPLVEARIASVQNLAVYLCGNEGMIKDVTAVLQKKGLCPIYREKYY